MKRRTKKTNEILYSEKQLARVLGRIRRETLASLDEWDHAKAAGLRRAAEIIEEEMPQRNQGEGALDYIKRQKEGAKNDTR